MKKLISLVFVSFMLLFLSSGFVFAQGPESKSVYIATDETVEKNPYFAAGERVEIYGVVNGDVYVSGGEVVVDGTINGDLFVAGGQVRVDGVVTNNVKAAGGQLTIGGEIGGNLVVAGGNIALENNASVGSYIVIAGGNVTNLGTIAGNSYFYAGNVSTNSQIEGDLEASVGMIRIGPKTTIGGDLTITSDEKPTIDESATIAGETQLKEPVVKVPQEIKDTDAQKASQAFARIRIFATLISAVSTFLVGLILIKLFPKYMESTKDQLEKNTWKSLGYGLLGLIIIPVLFILLLILVVTIPLALIIITVFSIYLYMAKIFVIYWAGRRFFKNSSQIASFGLSVLLYALLILIPIIGGFVRSITLLFGLGAGMLACQEVYNQMKAKKIA